MRTYSETLKTLLQALLGEEINYLPLPGIFFSSLEEESPRGRDVVKATVLSRLNQGLPQLMTAGSSWRIKPLLNLKAVRSNYCSGFELRHCDLILTHEGEPSEIPR